MVKQTTSESVELNKNKQENTPNHAQDEIEAAKEKARAARQAKRRTQSKEAMNYVDIQQVADAMMDTMGLQRNPENEKKDAKRTTSNEVHEEMETTENTASEEESRNETIEETEETIEDDDQSEVVPGNKLITKTINGKEVTRTVDEWLAIATKVEDADDYYQRASQTFTEAVSKKTQAEIKKEQERSAEEDLQLVRAIQTGTETEAVSALQKLREQSAQGARKTIETTSVQARFQAIQNRIEESNKDVFGDPRLKQVAYGIFNDHIKAQKVFDKTDAFKNFELLLNDATTQTKNWFSGIKNTTTAQTRKETLEAKKKVLTRTNTSNARVSKPATTESNIPHALLDPEGYAKYVAEQRAKARNQYGGPGRLGKTRLV